LNEEANSLTATLSAVKLWIDHTLAISWICLAGVVEFSPVKYGIDFKAEVGMSSYWARSRGLPPLNEMKGRFLAMLGIFRLILGMRRILLEY